MNAQIKLGEKHRWLINKCMKSAGYPAALARDCKLNPTIFRDLDKDDKTMSWGTLVALVEYARNHGVVGPFFDVITLAEPPDVMAVDKEVEDAAWMLQDMPREERAGLLESIAAAYGRYAMKKKDSDAI